jgi:hypothetical protein
MTHYQVCFTRVGDQGSGDGWQVVNASPELASTAVSSFFRFQNGNIYPPCFDAEDAADQVVTELQSDGSFAFLTKIKYGLKDQKGRPAMFAQAFVFPLNEFAEKPQEVLRVDDNNFTFDIEKTKSPRPVLTKSVELPLSNVVNELALNKSRYTTLVQCVYFVLNSKAKNSLHIICDCRQETIQKIMICIFYAVPFEFRKKISYSTYENQNGTPKVIIFNRQRSSVNGFFVDLKTGENNVLTDVLLKRWEKYEFMKIAPLNPAANINAHFKALEDKLSLFGSAQTTSLDLYKIAHDLIRDDNNKGSKPTSESLSKRLNEFLSISENHQYIDQQIKHILSDIVEFEVVLNDVLSEKLCRKLEKTQDKDLIQLGHLYNSEKISRMSVEEGGKYLFTAFENRTSDSFIQIRKLLDRDAKGREILNYLYTKLIADELPKDKDHIIAFYEETASLYDRSKIQESLYLLCNTYIKSTITDKTAPRFLMNDMDELLGKVLRDCPDLVSNTKRNIKKVYWDNFSYESLQITQRELYKDVLLQENSKAKLVAKLQKTYCYFAQGDVDSFKEQVDTLFATTSTYFTNEERSVLVKKLQDACLDDRHRYGSHELDVWLSLALLEHLEDKNPVQFLIENYISAMRYFDEAYHESRMLQNDRTRRRFVEYLEDYMKSKPEAYKTAEDALRVIKEYEKRAEQDKKRKQRELRRAQKVDSGKRPLFNIKFLFKKFLFKKKEQDYDD